MTDLLGRLAAEGRKLAGYGAPAKATTLLHHFGIDRSMIAFIVDDNPLKQGLFVPGTGIPIKPVEAMYKRHPDDVLILAWNFAESIIARHAQYREDGGRFIVPLPEIAIR